MNKKVTTSLLLSTFFVVALASMVAAATVTFTFPTDESIQSAAITPNDGHNVTIDVTVAITTADVNVTNMSFYYRATSSADWIFIGTNTTLNATQYLFPWRIDNLTDGKSYQLNATAINESVDAIGTAIIDVDIDNTPPTIKIETLDSENKDATKFFFGDKVTLKCTRSDATIGYNNTNMTIIIPTSTTRDLVGETKTTGSTAAELEEVFTATKQLGVYTVLCAAVDKAGNRNATINTTFEIIKKPPQGSTRPRGFVNPVGKQIISGTSDLGVLTEAEPISLQMRKTGVVKMDVKGKNYEFSVKELTEAEVSLVAAGASVKIKKGESQEVDLDKDGKNDVKITYHKQFKKGSRATADVTFEAVTTPAKAGPQDDKMKKDVDKTPTKKDTATSTGSLVVIIIVVVVIVVVGYLLIKGKKK